MILLAGKQFGTCSQVSLAHFRCTAVSSGVEALAHLISGKCQQAVLGQGLTTFQAIEVLELWRSVDPGLPIVPLWDTENLEALRRCIQLGISDFLIGQPELPAICGAVAPLASSAPPEALEADLLDPTPKLLTLFRTAAQRLTQRCKADQRLAQGTLLRDAVCQRMYRAYPWLPGYVPQHPAAHSLAELETELCSQLTILHTLFPQNVSQSFREILSYILTQMDREPHQPEIAGAFYLSSSALSQQFTRELGCGFRSYVAECRMLRAASLLSSLEPRQAAEQLGFQDYSYFTKQFRKRFGLFPAEYHKTRKEFGSCTQPIE